MPGNNSRSSDEFAKISCAKHNRENKERLQKKDALKISKPIQRRRKRKKRQYVRERYKDLSEDEKQKLFEDIKKFYNIKKSTLQKLSLASLF